MRSDPSSQFDWAFNKTGCTTMMLIMRVIIWYWLMVVGGRWQKRGRWVGGGWGGRKACERRRCWSAR